ncbi:MAG: hypothetical protein EOP10_01505, partial [Proteobacteria bacterium]
MRKLAFLAFMSSKVAFAHQVQFDDLEYLSINNDPAKAQAIRQYCGEKRLGLSSCKDHFAGAGNMAAEAVLKCEIKQQESRIQFSNAVNTAE